MDGLALEAVQATNGLATQIIRASSAMQPVSRVKIQVCFSSFMKIKAVFLTFKVQVLHVCRALLQAICSTENA